MVSQADRELIQNFVIELQPYLETVESGVQEFAGPAPDGVVVGQAVQALGMIRGAGSVLMIDDLVAITDFISQAFELIQQHADLEPADRVRRLRGLMSALRDVLSALDAGEETSPIVLRARTIFESIPRHDATHAATTQLGERDEIEALFDGHATRAARHTERLVDDEPASETSSEQPTDRLPSETGPEKQKPSYPTALPAGQFRRTDGEPVRIIPEQPVRDEEPPEVDPELREIFVEEAASLIVSFGENAKAIARRPGDLDAISRLRRDAHTLKGAANMTGFPMIGNVASAIERLLDEHLERSQPVSRETLELLVVCWKMLRAMLKRLDDLRVFVSPSNSLIQRTNQLRDHLVEPVPTQAPAIAPDHAAEPADSDEVISVGHVPAADLREPEETVVKPAAEQPIVDDVVTSDTSMRPDLSPTDKIPVLHEDSIEAEGEGSITAHGESISDAPNDEVESINTVDAQVSEAPAVEPIEPFWTPESPEVENSAPIEQSADTQGDQPAEPFWTSEPDDESDVVEEPFAPVEPLEPVEAVHDPEQVKPAWDFPVHGEVDDTTDRETVEVEAVSDDFFVPIVEEEPEHVRTDRLVGESLLEDVPAELDWQDAGVDDEEAGFWNEAEDDLLDAPPIWAEMQDTPSDYVQPAEDPDPFFAEAVGEDQPAQESHSDGPKSDQFDMADEPAASEQNLHDAGPPGPAEASEQRDWFVPSAQDAYGETEMPQWDGRTDSGGPLEADSAADGLTALASGLGGQIGDLNAALLEMAFHPAEPVVDRAEPGAGLDVLDESVESELAREMFETFALESADYLNVISRAAMQLDRNPSSPEPLREVRRALHTLKGAAAAADVDEISARCHQLEDTLAAYDAAGAQVDREFVTALFTGVDEIERSLNRRRQELRGETPETDMPSEGSATLRVDLGRIDDLLNTVGELVVSRAGLEQRLERLAATLDELSLAASRLQRSSYLLERETHSEDAIGRLIRGEFSRSGSLVTIGRMQQEDWDELEMERYTEFDRLIRQLAEVGADVGTAVAEIQGVRGDLDTISNRQRRLTNALQDELMGIRMVPIASAAPALYRVVRRVASRRGKQVNLVFEGGDTPFDKMLLDALNEPLLHLLRNAVDHGIETPEQRRALGKPEVGTIKIRAHHEGNEAIIDIVDDGAGIDHDRVIASARERGLDVPDDISRQDALRYIFLSGFSTRASADDVSGRGVGLEIVERAVERVKGRLAVDSLPGRGTMFSLRLPLQLSVTQAFLVEAGGGRFAVPIANIEYVAERIDQPLSEFGNAVVVDVNGSAIPVIDIAVRFGQPAAPVLEREEGWVMIAEVGGQRWALVVDALEGQQEIVVKPLGRFLRDQPALMGATILGNGEVALILDVPQILGNSPQATIEPTFDIAEPPADDVSGETVRDRGPLVALVVDDSLSVRRVVGRTLERYGWVPVLARDGVEGIEALETGDIDVVITDIEMPRMDGFELLTSIRGNEQMQDIPVIVLTSRSGEKHRGRAFELGANAYLVKPFQEQELIDMVNRTARVVPVAAEA